MLHEKQWQQMVVEKRSLGGTVVIEDEVALVLPPVEGKEQGQVVE